MLRKLRQKKIAKKIWIVLALLILPAFVLWGSGSVMRGKQEPSYAGIIFGKKISLEEYRDAYLAVNNLAIMRFGDSLPQVRKSLNLEALAWERLILLGEAKKRKLTASDKEVVETLKGYSIFMRQGRFDERLYPELLQYVFQTPARAFEEQTRQNIILAKLYEEVTSNIKLTDAEIKEEYQKLNVEISLYYIAALASDFTKDIVPSEQEIKDYFTKNSLSFKQPPSFNAEYVSLASAGQDENQTKEKIKKLFLRLHKKEDFSAVAKDFGLSVKETGLFTETDPIPGIGWAPQLMSIISKTKTGDYLPPAYIDKNFYILKIKAVKPPFVPELETIKDKLREALIKDKSQETARLKIESAFNALTLKYKTEPKLVDFEAIAKGQGLKSGATGLFKYGSYIEGIGASDVFWTQARGLKEDGFSQIIDTPEGFYIIKLKSKTDIDEERFSEEKAEFAKMLLIDKKTEYFAKFTQELKRKTQAFF